MCLLPHPEITALILPQPTTKGRLWRASQGGWGCRGDLRVREARGEGVEDLQVSKLLWLRTGALHLCHICLVTHVCVCGCVCVKSGHSWIPAVCYEVSSSCLQTLTVLPPQTHTHKVFFHIQSPCETHIFHKLTHFMQPTHICGIGPVLYKLRLQVSKCSFTIQCWQADVWSIHPSQLTRTDKDMVSVTPLPLTAETLPRGLSVMHVLSSYTI